MKLNYLKVLLILLLIPILGACAHKGGSFENPTELSFLELPDKCKFGVGTAGTSLDASGTFQGVYCPDGNGNWRLMTSEVTAGPTVAGSLANTFLGATVPAVIQADAVVRAAEKRGCKGDCGNTYVGVGNNNGSSSQSESISDATSSGTAVAGPGEFSF